MRVEQIANVVEIRPEQMPVVRLRLADPEDFAQVKKLNLAALELDPSAFGPRAPKRKDWTDEEWQAFIEKGYIQIGVNEKGEFVAMAGAKREKEEGVWQLHTVFVDPDHRKNIDKEGRRLSDRLITELIDTVRRERATEINLIVNQTKPAAVELYKRLGFTITQELPERLAADGKTYNKLAMSKTLLCKEDDTPLAA